MSRNAWRSSATKDVLFPDDIEDYGPLCVVGPPIPAEEADTDTVEHGVVAELSGDHHDEDFLLCPQQLRHSIADAWRDGEGMAVFEVTHAEKGPGDADPWVIETRVIENGDAL